METLWWNGMGHRRIARRAVAASLWLWLAVFAWEGVGGACSCGWAGPFLTVAPQAPLVIRGRVLAQVLDATGNPEAMEVKVLEVWRGAWQEPTIRIWGGAGWLCRPEIDRFRVGTEWVLAVDGPGSKPGATPDHALSMCGQYWLELVDEKARGNICDDEDMTAVQEAPLAIVRHGERQHARIDGEIKAGQPFERPFGPGFLFRLTPHPAGWTIAVLGSPAGNDLSRLTTPLRGPMNPLEIEGWQFRNADNSGPNEPGAKNRNAPQEVRDFSFSPDVPRLMDAKSNGEWPPAEVIFGIRCFGRGRLTITDYTLKNLGQGELAEFASMRFKVELSWPAFYAGADPRGDD